MQKITRGDRDNKLLEIADEPGYESNKYKTSLEGTNSGGIGALHNDVPSRRDCIVASLLESLERMTIRITLYLTLLRKPIEFPHI